MRTRVGLALLAVLALVGCKSHESKDEVKVAMADVPAPVRATLEKEAAGGKVTEVEKELKNGKTVYSADVTDKAGNKWDVVVGEDGKFISKEKD
jgi:uncharacterized membrane protein YkoI